MHYSFQRLVVLSLAITSFAFSSPADKLFISRLFKDSHQLEAIARAQGHQDITVLVISKPGKAGLLARTAERLKGDIRYREDEVGYLRIKFPIDGISEFSSSDAIDAITLDAEYLCDPNRLCPAREESKANTKADPICDKNGLYSPVPRSENQVNETWPPKWSDYPLRQPYSPIGDIDAAEFKNKYPAFDGRGVTVALLDGNPDLLLPEFQTAYNLNGTKVPKIADFLNATDPRDDAEHVPQWVNMAEEVDERDGKVTFQGKIFVIPRKGKFRIGQLNERRWNNYRNAQNLDQDLDRNGNPRGDDGLFGVLWDEKTNDVWVDTDRDLNFANEKALTDYTKRPEIGVFGKDNSTTVCRETIGFTVQTDSKNKYISINVGINQHATISIGSALGNREPFGRIQGIAPGSRLVSIFYGSSMHGMIEGLIMAFKHALVDLIVLEQNTTLVSHNYRLSDGRHLLSIIVRRLSEKHQKLLFVPGDNAPGFGFVAEDGVSTSVMSIGGYQSKVSYRINNGFIPEPADNMHWGALSHGPSGSGQLKPDILAPSGQMSLNVGYLYFKIDQELRGLYQLPPGYSIDGGTSAAAPMAAGATALVLSAAKQSGVKYNAKTLKSALTGSARFLENLKAYEQGNGLIQVGAAYRMLRALQDVTLVTISSKSSVKTKLSHLLVPPHQGEGLFEREGWTVGDKGTRIIHFARNSGKKEPMTFLLTWHGNDGTFKSQKTVTLPLNTQVDVPIQISVSSEGAHSAILTLDHPSIPCHVHRILATVVGAYRFREAEKYTINTEIVVPRPGDRPVFLDVPKGVAALAFSAQVEDAKLNFAAISPSRQWAGVNDDPLDVPRIITNPEPGVWEINVNSTKEVREYDPERSLPVKPAKVSLTARILKVDVLTEIPIQPEVGTCIDIGLRISNCLAPISAAATSVDMGSMYSVTRTIKPGEQHIYEVMVPVGASLLRAKVYDVAAPEADLDIYLIDATVPDEAQPYPPAVERDKGNKSPSRPSPSGIPKAKDDTMAVGGEMDLRNPKPGRWLVVVDGYAVPEGGTQYSYLDMFTHAKFGTLAVADDIEPRESGATWTAKAHAWAAEIPKEGRKLATRIEIKSPDILIDHKPVAIGGIDLQLDRVEGNPR